MSHFFKHSFMYFSQEALSALNFITQAPLRTSGSYAADTTMGANSSSPEGLANYRNLARPQKEETPFRLLTIRILRARNIQKADVFTESDCYVCLSLPTATSEKVRTITVSNSKNPVWNQSFCYRIDGRVKNILELKVCDEDTFTQDDHLFTVLFDVGKLQTGRTSRVNFNVNPVTHEELEVEFTLQPMVQRQPRVAAAAAPRTAAVAPVPRGGSNEGGLIATGTRWLRWIRSIEIPRPPGF